MIFCVNIIFQKVQYEGMYVGIYVRVSDELYPKVPERLTLIISTIIQLIVLEYNLN